MIQSAETTETPSRPREGTDLERILGMIDRLNGMRGAVIAVLEEIQAEHGYLPEEALRAVADGMGRSLVDVYGVATFYRSFSLDPRGRHLICVCLGTACHVRGAQMVVEEFERQLGIKAGETTPDREFTLETVNCLGACALGPIVVVDGEYFSNVGTAGVKHILEKARTGLTRVEEPAAAAAAV
jgi:NADH-quinone oxidoreductase subunit E